MKTGTTILHTSDWHIGRSLHNRKRYEEHEAFLSWLADLLEKETIDVLLVAGDVFDNTTPSNRAQELYYRFLCRVAGSACRHVVVTAGNHDSPSFLNAPRELLRHLNVHVAGCASPSPADEVLLLRNPDGEAELIVCAVPYLRDRDVRTVEAYEGPADKEQKLVEGIGSHYRQVCTAAEGIRAQLQRPVPIVAMGHLFTAGGRTVEDDGVRELYVGSLAHVSADIFPPVIDYLALGHLHGPQKIGGSDFRRYSGAPLPMGFGERRQSKEIVIVSFRDSEKPTTTCVPVPRFQDLERLSGDWPAIEAGLEALRANDSGAWLEIVYEGVEIAAELRERLDEAVAGTRMEILRVRNSRVVERALGKMHHAETLEDLDVNDVFQRCLDAHEVPEARRNDLLAAYREAVVELLEHDKNEQ